MKKIKVKIKKDLGSGNCDRSKSKMILHPHYTEGEGEMQDEAL